jgi:hypothetical protein
LESIAKICENIDQIWQYHLNVRSHFPFARKEHLGKQIIESSPYYANHGYIIKYDYGKELENDDIVRINKLSNWLNQNVLIRLYALMNYNDFVGEKIKIDKSRNGWKELDLLRRLRNLFAHTDGSYNSEDEEQSILVEELKSHFSLEQDTFDHFPISIDSVIEPIFEGCKAYVISARTE